MSKHDPLASLRQMLDHAMEARKLMEGKSRRSLDEDRVLELAVTRLLEIIGEAAGRVARAEREKYLAVD